MKNRHFIICIIFQIIFCASLKAQQTWDFSKNVLTISVHKLQYCGEIERRRTIDSEHFKDVVDETGGYTIGTGFVYAYNGKKYVITCNHVTYRADKIIAHDSSYENKYELRFVGTDVFNDIAVLEFVDNKAADKFEPVELQTIMKEGNEVISIGFWKLNNEGSCSHTGEIENTNKSVYELLLVKIGFIESSAHTEIGYSGGLLVDKKTGKVLGMNNAKHGENISYALRAEIIEKTIRQIIEKKQRAYFGIQFSQSEKGGAVMIDNVIEGSPASPERERLQGKNLIGVNGEPVEDIYELLMILENVVPKENISLELENDKVLLQARNMDTTAYENIARYAILKNDFDKCKDISISEEKIVIKNIGGEPFEVVTVGNNSDLIFCAPNNLAEFGILIRLLSLHKEIEVSTDIKHLKGIESIYFSENAGRRVIFY